MKIRVAILDDWYDTIRNLPCFNKLEPFEVVIFNDHVDDVNILAQRLEGFQALVLIRERTHFRKVLAELLPNL